MNAAVVPPNRALYLEEISASIRDYHAESNEVADQLKLIEHLQTANEHLKAGGSPSETLEQELAELRSSLPGEVSALLEEYHARAEMYRSGKLVYTVRGKDIHQPTISKSLAHSDLPRVALPASLEDDSGALFKWLRSENQPGFFPFTAGVFPLKRADEDPKRQVYSTVSSIVEYSIV
jgi:methylmalonyl-CoA mutase